MHEVKGVLDKAKSRLHYVPIAQEMKDMFDHRWMTPDLATLRSDRRPSRPDRLPRWMDAAPRSGRPRVRDARS
jgi:hypothetical protein